MALASGEIQGHSTVRHAIHRRAMVQQKCRDLQPSAFRREGKRGFFGPGVGSDVHCIHQVRTVLDHLANSSEFARFAFRGSFCPIRRWRCGAAECGQSLATQLRQRVVIWEFRKKTLMKCNRFGLVALFCANFGEAKKRCGRASALTIALLEESRITSAAFSKSRFASSSKSPCNSWRGSSAFATAAAGSAARTSSDEQANSKK